MSLTIELSVEEEAILEEQAQRDGVSKEEFALRRLHLDQDAAEKAARMEKVARLKEMWREHDESWKALSGEEQKAEVEGWEESMRFLRAERRERRGLPPVPWNSPL